MKKRYQIRAIDEKEVQVIWHIDAVGDRMLDPDVRTYWAPRDGGYVRDVTDLPGTLGWQVCRAMQPSGDCLYCSTGQPLVDVIRREMRRAMRKVDADRR